MIKFYEPTEAEIREQWMGKQVLPKAVEPKREFSLFSAIISALIAGLTIGIALGSASLLIW